MRGSLTDYVQETRPQFLILTPVCCLVGAASVYWKTGSINLLYLAIALVGGIAAHAAVNTLNDYHDYGALNGALLFHVRPAWAQSNG